MEKTSCSLKCSALRLVYLVVRLRVSNDLSKGGHLPKPCSKGLGSWCPTKDNEAQWSQVGLKMMLMCSSHIGLEKCKAVANISFAKK